MPSRTDKGLIYVARLRSGTIKVGFTGLSTAERLKELKAYFGPLKLLHASPGTLADEFRVHKALVSERYYWPKGEPQRSNEVYRPTATLFQRLSELIGLPLMARVRVRTRTRIAA